MIVPLLGLPQTQDKTIHVAAAEGDLARVLEVLAQQPELVEATDERGFAPLHLAVRSGHRDVVDALLSKGADLETIHERYGLTAVGFAFQSENQVGKADLTPYLISRGAWFDPDEPMRRGIRRLDMAVVFGNAAMVRFLLDIGADANAETAYPLPPLVNAASHGHAEIARLLLEHGTDVNVEDASGNPPMHWAVTRGHGDILQLLLGHGARVDFVETESGRNLVHLAALRGHLDAIDPLVARGIDLSVADDLGRTPLYYAAKYGHALVADRLIDHGAAEPADLEERYGMSPHLTRPMDEGLSTPVVIRFITPPTVSSPLSPVSGPLPVPQQHP